MSFSHLGAFGSFFVSLNLPYAVVRGEQLGLEVTVFNYLDIDIEEVLVELEENDNLLPVISTVLTNETNEVEQNYMNDHFQLWKCVSVAASSCTTIIFAVKPRKVGPIVIKVKARSNIAFRAAADERQLLVVPEGRAVEYTRNVLLGLFPEWDMHFQLGNLGGNLGVKYRAWSGLVEESINLALPPDAVADSGHAIVSVIANLMGPPLNKLEQLLDFWPSMDFLPDAARKLSILRYLDMQQELTDERRVKAYRNLTNVLERLLSCKHDDDSYSFDDGLGPLPCSQDDDRYPTWREHKGNLWFTTVAVNLYELATYYIHMDYTDMLFSCLWIARQQSDNGTFSFDWGPVKNIYAIGGLFGEGETAQTAFVLITLVHACEYRSHGHSIVEDAIAKAREYLEGELNASDSNSYTICIMTYALALSRSSKTAEAIAKMKSIAVIDGGLMHWTNDGGRGQESDHPYHFFSFLYQKDIEMTGYALLAIITATYDLSGGLPAARWLSQQRHFLDKSTTIPAMCAALQAFGQYPFAVERDEGIEPFLDITLTSDVDENFSHSFTVYSENAPVVQQVEAPVGGNVKISGHASGSRHHYPFLQARVSYTVERHRRRRSQPAYDLAVNVTEKNNGDSIVVALCSTYKKSKDSGMVVVSSVLPSGFRVDIDAMEMYMDSDQDVRRYDVSGNQVDLYLNQLVYNSKKCVQIPAVRQHNVGNVQPVPAVVYSYYEPDLEKESVLYAPSGMVGVTVCELCVRNQNCAGCDQYTQSRNITRSTVTPTLTTTRSSSVSSSLAVTVLVVFVVGVRALVE